FTIVAFQCFLAAYFNIPAFIVPLGGLLAWRGAIKGISSSETIPIASPAYKTIGQGNFDILSGWILAAICILLVLFLAFKRAKAQETYGLGKADYAKEMLKAIFPIAAIIAFIYVMNSADGVPLPVLIFLIVALVGGLSTN